MSQNGCADGAPDGQTWILLSTILVLGMSPGAVKPHDVVLVSNAFAKHSLNFSLSTISHLQFFSNPFLFTGLALFEAGLIRMKNTVTFIAQIFMGVAVLSTMWLLFGFSLSHGTDTGGFIGDFANGMFVDVSYTRCYDGMHVSEASYATFMMMFAIISPLLMTGGFAERVPFPAFLCVTVACELQSAIAFFFFPTHQPLQGKSWSTTPYRTG
jgi:ammonia channel protein AmtB